MEPENWDRSVSLLVNLAQLLVSYWWIGLMFSTILQKRKGVSVCLDFGGWNWWNIVC
jgi:hypothetical protein